RPVMKKSLLLCGLLLAMSASLAFAAPGTNLRYLACFGDAGAPNRAFACASNSGSNLLLGSFPLGADQLATTGIGCVLDVAVAGASLPTWWQYFNVGACRQASLTCNGVISALAVNCADWSAGFANGGLAAYQLGSNGPPALLGGANTARVIIGFAVSAANVQ